MVSWFGNKKDISFLSFLCVFVNETRCLWYLIRRCTYRRAAGRLRRHKLHVYDAESPSAEEVLFCSWANLRTPCELDRVKEGGVLLKRINHLNSFFPLMARAAPFHNCINWFILRRALSPDGFLDSTSFRTKMQRAGAVAYIYRLRPSCIAACACCQMKRK